MIPCRSVTPTRYGDRESRPNDSSSGFDRMIAGDLHRPQTSTYLEYTFAAWTPASVAGGHNSICPGPTRFFHDRRVKTILRVARRSSRTAIAPSIMTTTISTPGVYVGGLVNQELLPWNEYLPLRIEPILDGPPGSSCAVFYLCLSASGRRLCAALRMASASAMSCGRPDASFDAMRSSAEMKFAFRPVAVSITVSTRLSHAASKSTPGMVGKNIEAFRVTSKTKEAVAVGEIFRADALERCAELGKRGIGRFRVFRVRFYEKVHVLRKARLRVIDNREAAHNEVFNAMGMEGGQKVFVVLVHPARSPTP